MATNIGTLAAVITLNSQQFTANSKSVGNTAKQMAATVTGVLAAIAVPVTAAGFASWLQEGLVEVRDMDNEARKAGVSINDLGGLMRLAGGDGEGFVRGIGKMHKSLGEVQGPASEAASAFHAIGLNALNLKQLGTIDAFGKIADQLNMLANDSDKAYYSSKIFGKGYQTMLEGISKGSGGINDAVKKNKELMGVFSPQEVANTRMALRAIKDVDDSVSSIKRHLAVTSAPFITALAQGIRELIPNAGTFNNSLTAVLRVTAGFAAEFLTTVNDIKNAFKDVKLEASDLIEVYNWFQRNRNPGRAFENTTGLDIGFGQIATRGGGAKPGTSQVDTAINRLKKFSETGQLPFAAIRPDATKDLAINHELMAAMEAQEKQLRESIGTIGKTADETERWKLSQLGATDAMLKSIGGLQDQRNALKYIDEARAPLDRFSTQLDELNRLYDAGKIGLDVYGDAAMKAANALGILGKTGDAALPSLATAGSREAFDVLTRSESKQSDPSQRIVDAINASKVIEQRIDTNTREMAAQWRRITRADLKK